MPPSRPVPTTSPIIRVRRSENTSTKGGGVGRRRRGTFMEYTSLSDLLPIQTIEPRLRLLRVGMSTFRVDLTLLPSPVSERPFSFHPCAHGPRWHQVVR